MTVHKALCCKNVSFAAFVLIKARAEAMQRASDLTASGLFFVHGLKKEDLQEKLKCILAKRQHRKRNFETFLDIVIDSYPKGHVVGATVDCNEDILALNNEKVSGNLSVLIV